MLSSKLIQSVEDHWESIASRVIRQIREDPELFHFKKLPDSELREMGQEIFKNLGHWLVASREQDVARRYEFLGQLRYRELVPLHESVRGLHIVKNALLDYIRGEGLGPTAVELYAEEELEHEVGRFFDSLVFHLVKGYEGALRHAAHMGARA